MRSQKSVVRKSEKAKARRKDYQKKINVRRNNKPTFSKLLRPGDGILPKSRKFVESKKTKKEREEIIINTRAKTSATGR